MSLNHLLFFLFLFFLILSDPASYFMGKINLDSNYPMTFVPNKSLVRGAWVSQVLKNPPANVGDTRDRVCSLGQEDPLEEGTATHPSILA